MIDLVEEGKKLSCDEVGPAQIAAQEAMIAKSAKAINRACGKCTLCCKLIPIATKEITKPADKWCQHCEIGQGCKIYESRPRPCRTWTCQWLVDPTFGDHWFPAKSKMVVSPLWQYVKAWEISVDPGFPNRWREEPWFSEIRRFARTALEKGRIITIIVVNGDRKWIVLPNKTVEFASLGMAMQIGEDEWHWFVFKDEEQALKTAEYMESFSEWLSHATPEDRLEAIKDMQTSILMEGRPVPQHLIEAELNIAQEIDAGR